MQTQQFALEFRSRVVSIGIVNSIWNAACIKNHDIKQNFYI